jgi:hypothetical protein
VRAHSDWSQALEAMRKRSNQKIGSSTWQQCAQKNFALPLAVAVWPPRDIQLYIVIIFSIMIV